MMIELLLIFLILTLLATIISLALGLIFTFFYLVYSLIYRVFRYLYGLDRINVFIINIRFKVMDYILSTGKNSFLFYIYTFIGLYLFNVFQIKYVNFRDFFLIIEDFKNICAEFDFKLYSNINDEFISKSE